MLRTIKNNKLITSKIVASTLTFALALIFMTHPSVGHTQETETTTTTTTTSAKPAEAGAESTANKKTPPKRAAKPISKINSDTEKADSTTSGSAVKTNKQKSTETLKNQKNKNEKTTAKETKMSDRVIVVMEVSVDPNPIEIELFAKEAPISVANFLRYVDEGFYDGTIFHRVIPEFMVQGGGMLPDMKEKPNHEQIKNEAANGLKNERGTLAMARTNVVDSATSQFFINTKENTFLNHSAPTPSGYGYAVFGKVIKGMDVVDKMERVTTTQKGYHENVPAQPLLIKKISRKAVPAST